MSLNRRSFLRKTAGAAALTALAGKAGAYGKKGNDTSRPNVVLLFTDDQGWDDVGYMNPAIQTPNINKMSEEGVTFTRFYAAAASCSPSRAGFMTGRNHLRTGVVGINVDSNPLRIQERTLAHLMRSAGYQTSHFGKWHLGHHDDGGPVKVGYHEALWNGNKYPDNASLTYSREDAEDESVKLDGDCSMTTMDHALEFMKRANDQGKPFFTTIWYGSPHAPYDCSQEYTDLYPDSPCKEYLAEITGIDKSIGRLREELKNMGIDDNTLVWFSCDNGRSSQSGCSTGMSCGADSCIPAPISGGKTSMYEGGFRSPGVFVWPARFPVPKTIDAPCGVIDYYPTFKAILNTSYPWGQPMPLDGENILPILEQGIEDRAEPLYFWRTGKVPASTVEMGHGKLAMVEKRYKLIDSGDVGKEDPKRYPLYDLQADPREENNLAQDMPDLHAAMVEKLLDWQRSVLDSFEGKDYETVGLWKPGTTDHAMLKTHYSTGRIHVQIDGHSNPGVLELLDPKGALMYVQSYSGESAKAGITIHADLKPGKYIIRVNRRATTHLLVP